MNISEMVKDSFPSWFLWIFEHLTNPFVFIPLMILGFIALVMIFVFSNTNSSSSCSKGGMDIGDVLITAWWLKSL